MILGTLHSRKTSRSLCQNLCPQNSKWEEWLSCRESSSWYYYPFKSFPQRRISIHMSASALSEYAWEFSYTRMAPRKMSSCPWPTRRDESLLCDYSKCSCRSDYSWLFWFFYHARSISSCWMRENAWYSKDIWISPKTNPWLYRIYPWRKALHQWTEDKDAWTGTFLMKRRKINISIHDIFPATRKYALRSQEA